MTLSAPPALAMPPVPRQFALVLDADDDEYAEYVEACQPADPVLWWGVEFGGRALLYHERDGGRLDTGRFSSAEAALDVFDRVAPLKLVWL